MKNLVRKICRQENLKVDVIRPLSGGQVNAVYLIDQQFVVRVGTRDYTFERFKQEVRLFEKLAPEVPVPRVVACGRHQGVPYQIQHVVPGQPMHRLWNRLSKLEKEAVVSEFVSYLRVIHGQTDSRYGPVYRPDASSDSWLDYCERGFRATLRDLGQLSIDLPPDLLELATDYVDQHKHNLAGGRAVQVHGDLWPGNILINDGKISAILDFEFSIQAPRDYELLLVEQFCLYPNDYAEEDNEIFCAADFSDFFQLLSEHYVELFQTPHLRQRLNIYHIMYGLRSYVSWRKTQPAERKLGFPIPPAAKVLNFVFDNGVRMFL